MEKRMAGDYEIIHAFVIGDKEVVIGENPNADEAEQYMCAFCDQNAFLALYNDIFVSNDFCEITKLYADRISEQAEKTRQSNCRPKFQGIDTTPLTKRDCTPITAADNLNEKIVVIKPDILRREFRLATNQIKLCTGGFGANPNSRGSACFCVDLYSGKQSRFERMDILGTLTPEQLPKWAELGLVQYRQVHQKNMDSMEER